MKRERGLYDYKITGDNSIVVCKWNDNNIVHIASNCTGVEPLHTAIRYSQKLKKKIYVKQPNSIKMYNMYMGGVDRNDQNTSLYRVAIRGKKWYFSLIAHVLDLAEQNAWHIHRSQYGTKLDHLTFRRRVAMTLLEGNRNIFRRPSSSLADTESRFDRRDHLITTQEKQTRCRVCHNKVSTKCIKCNAALHVKCFIPYHTNN